MKELLKEVKKREIDEEVKSDLLKEMFKKAGVPEKKVQEEITKKVKKDLEEKNFL